MDTDRGMFHGMLALGMLDQRALRRAPTFLPDTAQAPDSVPGFFDHPLGVSPFGTGQRQVPCGDWIARICSLEWNEWTLARALLSPSHTILELGARYGTTSCVLSQITRNSGRVIAIEPDPSVSQALAFNRIQHNCSFQLWQGTVSERPMSLGDPSYKGKFNFDYAQVTTAITNTSLHRRVLPHVSHVSSLEDALGLRVDALLIDCEGCIDELWGAVDFARIEVIIMEEDGPKKKQAKGYSAVHERLRELGFERVWRVHGEDKCEHSGWRRRGTLPGLPSCEEYAARMKLNETLLSCLKP